MLFAGDAKVPFTMLTIPTFAVSSKREKKPIGAAVRQHHVDITPQELRAVGWDGMALCVGA